MTTPNPEAMEKALRLILAIEEHPDSNPETVVLKPASRRQLRAALGLCPEDDSLKNHVEQSDADERFGATASGFGFLSCHEAKVLYSYEHDEKGAYELTEEGQLALAVDWFNTNPARVSCSSSIDFCDEEGIDREALEDFLNGASAKMAHLRLEASRA